MNAFVAVFLPLLLAYGVTLSWCVARWNAETRYFEHCWLVPLVGAVVVFWRRRDWQARPAASERAGWWLLGPALLLHFVGALLMIDSWSAASLVLAVPGAARLALGRQRLQGLWPVLWLVLFVVPLPIYVEGRVAFTLKEFAVQGGSWLANLVGAGVVRHGDLLQPSGSQGSLYVADACGGLRSLMAMLTLGYCLAFFVGAPAWPRRLVLLLATAPLAITANIVRIAVLCLLARGFGVPFAEGTGHTLANTAEWLADLLGLGLLDGWLSRRCVRRAPANMPVAAPVEVPVATAGASRGLGLWLWSAGSVLLALSLYRPFVAGQGRAEQLPANVAGYVLVPRTAAEEAQFQRSLPRWRELLGTADFVWRRYRADQDACIHLVALFHDANWKSVHPPRICIEGSNMDIEQDDEVPAPGLGTGVSVSRIVARGKSDGWRRVTLSLFGTRDWASGDYSAFTWYHLPRALLRANESGFLLRVESPVGKSETTADAEARCARFLGDLVLPARELLR